MLGEGDTFGINGSFGAPEKKFSTNFSKANTILLEFIITDILNIHKYLMTNNNIYNNV